MNAKLILVRQFGTFVGSPKTTVGLSQSVFLTRNPQSLPNLRSISNIISSAVSIFFQWSKVSKVFSVDLPVITSSTPFQMAVTGSLSFTVIGTSFSSSTFITRVRISLSVSESEGWLYDSSILCKIAAFGNIAVNGNITGKSS